MPLINCEINLTLTWSENCVIFSAADAAKFATTDTTLYLPLVPLSTRDNAKLLQQLQSGLKSNINWNRYQSKLPRQTQNQNLDFLI